MHLRIWLACIALTILSLSPSFATNHKERHYSSTKEHNMAANPLMKLGFSNEHVLDFLRVCYSDTADCRLLTRESNGRTEVLILIGEQHRQSKEAFVRVARLLKHYKVVALEGRPMGDIPVVRSGGIEILEENEKYKYCIINRNYAIS